MADSQGAAYYAPRLLLTIVALATSYFPFWADFNETHVYNPRWPGHAVFHAGQTMTLGPYLGLATLWLAFRPSSQPSKLSLSASAAQQLALKKQKEDLGVACVIAACYYITQFSAIFYPNSLAVDKEFLVDGGPPIAFPQLMFGVPALTLCTLAWWLESGRVGRAMREVESGKKGK